MDPTVARRKVTVEVQDQREELSASLCIHSFLGQIHTSSGSRAKKTATHPPSHARTPTKTACFKPGSTIHTCLRPWSPDAGSWRSRSLDDVVEELHGLHDVFILGGDEGFRSGGICALSRQT